MCLWKNINSSKRMTASFSCPRGNYTLWKSSMDTENILRHQIDYILVNKRYRNTFFSVKTYPRADLQSNHNPRRSFQNAKKVRKRQEPRYDFRKLKNEVVRKWVQAKLNEHHKPSSDPTRIEDELNQLCESVIVIKTELLREADEEVMDDE